MMVAIWLLYVTDRITQYNMVTEATVAAMFWL